MSALASFNFQNLILERDPGRARMRTGQKGEVTLMRPPESLYPDLRELFGMADASFHRNTREPDFLIEYNGHRYRVALIEDGAYALRRASSAVPSLAGCKFHPRVIERLLAIKAGTVFVFGGFSTGKTTAASAYLTDKVRYDGSLGVAVEDPSELPLKGDYGEGRIYQISISKHEIETRVQDMMRTNFDAMMISELRTPLMCHVFLQAGLIGRLFISTGHGDTIIDGLRRVLSLASSLNTGGETGAVATYSQLADSFQAAILMKENNGRYAPASYLFGSRSTKAMFLNRDLESLKNNIDLTMSRLQSATPGPLTDD